MITEHIKEHEILGLEKKFSDVKALIDTEKDRAEAAEEYIASQIAAGGNGNVFGPETSEQGNIAGFGGATGKVIGDLGYSIQDILDTVETEKIRAENAEGGLSSRITDAMRLFTVSLSSASVTISEDNAECDGFILSGTLTADVNLVVPNTVRPYQIINNCIGEFTVTIKTAAGSGVTFLAALTKMVYCNGANVVEYNIAGNGVPINCGSRSFKDVVLANPGKTRFSISDKTTDGPVFGVNYMVDVIWFVASSTAASCYFKAIARNVVNVDNFTEYEIWYYAGTWGTWKHVRDQYGVKSMGCDDIGSGKTLADLLAFMPATGIAERWFNIQTASGVGPDTIVNYRTLAIGSQGGCILIAYGSNTNHSEWVNRYNGTTLTWTGWIRKITALGYSAIMGIDANTSATALEDIRTGHLRATDVTERWYSITSEIMPTSTDPYRTQFMGTSGNCRVVAYHPTNKEIWEKVYTASAWSGWTKVQDSGGRATSISVPVISGTACLPIILENPFVTQFSASGVTDITVHGASVYGEIHCDWRSATEVHVIFKHNGSYATYSNFYQNGYWGGVADAPNGGWVKLTDGSGNAVNANSLGNVVAASYLHSVGDLDGAAQPTINTVYRVINSPAGMLYPAQYGIGRSFASASSGGRYVEHHYQVGKATWTQFTSNSELITLSGWYQLTDANGNAINANSLGGTAAADYALKTDTAPDSSKLGGKTYATLFDASGKAVGLYRGTTIAQSGALENGREALMNSDGFAKVSITASGIIDISLDGVVWAYVAKGANIGTFTCTIPVRNGQKVSLFSDVFTSAYYYLYAPLA